MLFGSRAVAVAAISAICLFSSVSAQAAAMRCSSEEQTCVAVCNKMAIKPNLSACVTACGQRAAVCKKTGCWDNGAQQYCGLQRN